MAELTPREREVLALMAEGRSNQGICQTSGSARRPSRPTSGSAFAKLGIKEAPEDNRRVSSPCSPTCGGDNRNLAWGHGARAAILGPMIT